MPHDQNAANQRIDDVKHQRQLHLLLADDSCERVTFPFPLHRRLAYLILPTRVISRVCESAIGNPQSAI
jgi:hypothetical protein